MCADFWQYAAALLSPLQLPVLRNLQRVIDELAFGVNTAQALAGPSSRLIVEQVGPTPCTGVSVRKQPSTGSVSKVANEQSLAGSGRQPG